MSVTPQGFFAKHGARLAIYVLLALVIGGVFLQVRQWREDAKTGAERIEQRDSTAAAAGGIAEDISHTTTEQQRVEIIVAADTRKLTAELEILRRENAPVDDWLRRPVPVELRELARQRREARDRLGAVAPGRGGNDQGEAADGRDSAR